MTKGWGPTCLPWIGTAPWSLSAWPRPFSLETVEFLDAVQEEMGHQHVVGMQLSRKRGTTCSKKCVRSVTRSLMISASKRTKAGGGGGGGVGGGEKKCTAHASSEASAAYPCEARDRA